MAVPQRRLRDIRTLSANIDQSLFPYRSYVRLSFIEMEMGRRDVEKRNALRRVTQIDAHCVALRAEREKILRELGNPQPQASPDRISHPAHRFTRFLY